MGNNEPAVDQSDLRIRSSYGLNTRISHVRSMINPRRMRSEGYSSRSVCQSVYLFVSIYSRTTGYEAAYERYQQLQCYKGRKNNVTILLKPLRSGDMA